MMKVGEFLARLSKSRTIMMKKPQLKASTNAHPHQSQKKNPKKMKRIRRKS
jgi:hypothetical protein